MAVSYYQQHRPREATITVSRSPDFSGDFVCDGVADDVEFQAAIDFVNGLGGGKVYIGRGDYSISAPIDIYGSIWICGAGSDTDLALADNADCNLFQYLGVVNQFWFMLSDMFLDGNSANNAVAGTGLYIAPGAGTFSDWRIRDVIFMRFRDFGIYTTQGWQSYIHGCTIEHCLDAGMQLLQGNIFIDETAFLFNRVGLWLTSGNQFGVHHCIFHHQTESGMRFETACDYSEVSDSWFVGNGTAAVNTHFGIFVDQFADYNIITGCFFDGEAQSRNGVYVEAGSDANTITDCIFWDHVTAPIFDGGDNTQLPTKIFQFIQGTTFISADGSAKGWEINAEADMAVALGQLPSKVQQVVRIKIWAVALGAPAGAGGQMHLDILFNAGGSLEAYNLAANSWTLANFDSEEADYVNTNVIHWVVEDGDVGDELLNLLGGDSLELKVNGGTAIAPDGATNATFRVIEIEYV